MNGLARVTKFIFLLLVHFVLTLPIHAFAVELDIKLPGKATDKLEMQHKKINGLSNVLPASEITVLKAGRLTPDSEDKFFNIIQNRKTRMLNANGGVDTGGGSIVTTVHGTSGLIDFFTNAPDLFGKAEYRPRLKVPMTKALVSNKYGIEKIDLKMLGAWQVLSLKVAAWEKSSPLMSSYLKDALNHLPIYFVNYELKLVDQRYFIPQNLKNEIYTLNTVAFYRKDIGLIISRPEFEELPYDDQIGLLMKEILRHIQITYETHLSDEEMQRLNVALIRGPFAGETLDSAKYLSGRLLTQILDESLLEVFTDNLFKDVYEYSRKKHLGLVTLDTGVDSIKDLIVTLTNRLETVEDPADLFEIRMLLRRAFRVLDWSLSNQLTRHNRGDVYDAAQGISIEKIKLDTFIKRAQKRE